MHDDIWNSWKMDLDIVLQYSQLHGAAERGARYAHLRISRTRDGLALYISLSPQTYCVQSSRTLTDRRSTAQSRQTSTRANRVARAIQFAIQYGGFSPNDTQLPSPTQPNQSWLLGIISCFLRVQRRLFVVYLITERSHEQLEVAQITFLLGPQAASAAAHCLLDAALV